MGPARKKEAILFTILFLHFQQKRIYIFSQIENQIRNLVLTEGKIVWETFLLLKSEFYFILVLILIA